MTTFIDMALVLLALPIAAACLYLLVLTLLSGTSPAPLPSRRRLRFDVVVPAHDEAMVIERSIASLLAMDWPLDRFRLLVIADNCEDDTAQLARDAGAEVLERRDAERRGKGYALEFAFEASQTLGWADALVVVDADTVVSANLLEAFAARIEAGAPAVQAHYGVLNPHDSWRTRLLTIALASFHVVRSRARARLGLSCGIRGNGWCVTQRLLREVPYQAFSLAEDLEYGIDLGLAGYRVHYADEARADGEMVSSEEPARTQRQRWEDGRFDLLRSRVTPLLRAAVRRRDAVCLDLALDLLLPPLSYVALAVAALITVAGLASSTQSFSQLPVWLGLASGASLLLYVLRGWQLSGVGPQGLVDLACAPLFVLWKLVLTRRSRDPGVWIRTKREHS